MCNPALLIAGVGAGLLNEYMYKRKEKKVDAAQKAAKTAQEELEAFKEHNKLANSVQSTEELKNPTLAEQLKQQKVPLNTGSTGASTASPTSVGLNLGGY